VQDIQGNIKDVTSNQLKTAILHRTVNVVNLTLTSDGRLIDKCIERKVTCNKENKNELNELVTLINKTAEKICKEVTYENIELKDKKIESSNNKISIQYNNKFKIRYESGELRFDAKINKDKTYIVISIKDKQFKLCDFKFSGKIDVRNKDDLNMYNTFVKNVIVKLIDMKYYRANKRTYFLGVNLIGFNSSG
jgi:hypothetical protein